MCLKYMLTDCKSTRTAKLFSLETSNKNLGHFPILSFLSIQEIMFPILLSYFLVFPRTRSFLKITICYMHFQRMLPNLIFVLWLYSVNMHLGRMSYTWLYFSHYTSVNSTEFDWPSYSWCLLRQLSVLISFWHFHFDL